jgi:hypothetical protein
MTFTTFLVKFVAVVACALFGAGFSAGTAKAFKNDEFGEFGVSLMLTVGFITGLIKILWM